MRHRTRAARAVRVQRPWPVLFAGVLLASCAMAAQACELLLRDHRSGRELARMALPPAQPQLQIAFEHSVLGTTVIDTYRFVPSAVLIEEQFEGTGYGLPHAAAAGETLRTEGARSILTLHRPVEPLVIRNLPAQRMRILLSGRELELASLPAASIELLAQRCPSATP